MKIACNRDTFLHGFQTAATIAPSRSPKPILQNIKIEAMSDQTILMATDMELGIRIAIEGVQIETPGSAILPVARFGSLLRESGDEQLLMVADGQGITVSGSRSEFHLPAQNPDEFPSIEGFTESQYAEMSATQLKELIRRTLFATDTESTRFALGGVLLELGEEEAIAVGTDGRRLAKMQTAIRWEGGYRPAETTTIVPSKSMQLIDRAVAADPEAKVSLVARSNDLLLRTGNSTIYTRLVDGRFPKWRDVIPDGKQGVVIDLTVGPVFSAVRQAAIVANEDSRGIDFTFGGGSLVLSGQTADVGRSRVELPISYEGQDIVVKLDHRFVSDFLKVLSPDSQFQLNITNADSAALCSTNDGYNYVLMPLARATVAKSA